MLARSKNPSPMFLFGILKPVNIQGEKINLRTLRKDDFPRIDAWLSDADLTEPAFGLSRSDPNFSNLISAYGKEIKSNRRSFLGIEEKSGALIGFCSHILFPAEARARIGILIGDKKLWGKGYGKDAVTCLVRYLFRQKNVRLVELDTAKSNARAQQCFESCGFKAVLRDWSSSNGRLWYELSKTDSELA